MPVRSPATHARFVPLLLLMGACATRVTRPASDHAAAQPSSAAAPVERVDVVLTSEPPLPGTPLGDWKALESTTPVETPGHGHHHGATPAGAAR